MPSSESGHHILQEPTNTNLREHVIIDLLCLYYKVLIGIILKMPKICNSSSIFEKKITPSDNHVCLIP